MSLGLLADPLFTTGKAHSKAFPRVLPLTGTFALCDPYVHVIHPYLEGRGA